MLFRGTDSYRSEEIDQIFHAMGAEINAGTDRESTSLYTRVYSTAIWSARSM